MQHASPTKLLVRHARAQKFLKSTGRWTRRTEAACNFPNMVNAIHTCLASGIQDVQVVLRFEGDTMDRCFPLNCS